MLVIGLTGGIGSGKSAASDRFQARGVTVVDADVCAREVVEPGEPALQAIAAHFGAEVLQADGGLDRRRLRDIVFANSAERTWLEQLLHPRIRERIQQHLASAQSPYALLVSPLLFEAKQNSLVDRVLLIDVPEALARQRAAARDGVPESQIEAIMKVQMARDERQTRADDIVLNDSDLETLHQRVDALHERYLALTRQP